MEACYDYDTNHEWVIIKLWLSKWRIHPFLAPCPVLVWAAKGNFYDVINYWLMLMYAMVYAYLLCAQVTRGSEDLPKSFLKINSLTCNSYPGFVDWFVVCQQLSGGVHHDPVIPPVIPRTNLIELKYRTRITEYGSGLPVVVQLTLTPLGVWYYWWSTVIKTDVCEAIWQLFLLHVLYGTAIML